MENGRIRLEDREAVGNSPAYREHARDGVLHRAPRGDRTWVVCEAGRERIRPRSNVVKNGLMVMILLLCMVLLSCNRSPSSTHELEEFLGPLPGATLLYVSNKGPDPGEELVGKSRIGPYAIQVEQRGWLGAEEVSFVYELAVEGNQIIKRVGDKEQVLFRKPLKKNTSGWQWKGKRWSGGESKPWSMDCRISWVGDLEVLKEVRAAISVTCINDDEETVTEVSETYAAGIGLVRSTWLTRSSSGEVEDELTTELREIRRARVN